jgi:hypothetical protein
MNSDVNSTGVSSDNSDFLDTSLSVIDNLLENMPAAENLSDISVDYSLQDILQANYGMNYLLPQYYTCPPYSS